ncbi:MAG: YggS family pyridoxal phosphate-dependent enzyme [Planctomycetota bacterium]|jgi:pyridoxal phosphate enzyme (YggS family)
MNRDPDNPRATTVPPERLEQNVRSVRKRISDACLRAGRSVESVKLVAVTKNRSAADVDALNALGIENVGENRVQEALQKKPAVQASVTWHMIGHLQKNKAGKALDLFSSLHSADSLALLRALDRKRETLGAGDPFPAFVQVNVSGETSKSGIPPEELAPFLEQAGSLDRILIAGLMTMPPWSEDPEEARPHFRALVRIARDAVEGGLLPRDPGLSMGMTNDFEVAIEEGATVIRVGSAFFAPDP